MKNSNAKYLIIALIIAVGAIGVSFYSCEKEEIIPNKTTPTMDPEGLNATTGNTIKTGEKSESLTLPENHCGEIHTSKILLADGETVGNANVYNDDKFMYIDLQASRGYFFGEAKMHVAYDFAKFPLDENRNPDITIFRYVSDENNPNKVKHIKVDLRDLIHNDYMVAVVTKVQTAPERPGKQMLAWINGREFGNDLKGRIFKYSKSICPIDEPVQDLVEE